MNNKKPHTVSPIVIYWFFALGIISAFAFRAIIILQRFEPAWVRPVWYVGVLGFTAFFMYRFYISEKRKKTIARFQLIEKLKANVCLTEEDRDIIVYLLSSLKKSPENINYFIIFLLSILAIVLDLFLTFVM